MVTLTSFFFSSRRRHTRCSRDWSSDVCSSDLDPRARGPVSLRRPGRFKDRPPKKKREAKPPVFASHVKLGLAGDRKSGRVGKEGRSRWAPHHKNKKKLSGVVDIVDTVCSDVIM